VSVQTVRPPGIAYTGPWHQFLFREIVYWGGPPTSADLAPTIEREQRWLRRAYEREYGILADHQCRWVLDQRMELEPSPGLPVRHVLRVSLLPLVANLPARPLPPDALTYDDDEDDE
jgi:hypothetical protein